MVVPGLVVVLVVVSMVTEFKSRHAVDTTDSEGCKIAVSLLILLPVSRSQLVANGSVDDNCDGNEPVGDCEAAAAALGNKEAAEAAAVAAATAAKA